jgi:hypothetical protein
MPIVDAAAYKALPIVQDCAKRLGLLIPKTIEWDGKSVDPTIIDYDALLLLFLLNANMRRLCIAQVLPQTKIFFNSPLIDSDVAKFLYFYPNFALILDGQQATLGFGKLISDEIRVTTPTKTVIFRAISSETFLTFCPQFPQFPLEMTASQAIPDEKRENRDNFPTENVSRKVLATNIESGFYRCNVWGSDVLFFINNMISEDELKDKNTIMSFIYQANSCVFDHSTQLPTTKFFWNDDYTLIDTEILKLGVVLDYKRRYNLDASVELDRYAQYSAALEKNAQVLRATKLNPKVYRNV